MSEAQSIVTGGLIAESLVQRPKHRKRIPVVNGVDDPLAFATGRDPILRPQHRQLLRQGGLEDSGVVSN